MVVKAAADIREGTELTRSYLARSAPVLNKFMERQGWSDAPILKFSFIGQVSTQFGAQGQEGRSRVLGRAQPGGSRERRRLANVRDWQWHWFASARHSRTELARSAGNARRSSRRDKLKSG